jgi:hypothetical protein
MAITLTAHYKDGKFVPCGNVDYEIEETDYYITIEPKQSENAVLNIEEKKRLLKESFTKHKFKLPNDYKFNRDELYER